MQAAAEQGLQLSPARGWRPCAEGSLVTSGPRLLGRGSEWAGFLVWQAASLGAAKGLRQRSFMHGICARSLEELQLTSSTQLS